MACWRLAKSGSGGQTASAVKSAGMASRPCNKQERHTPSPREAAIRLPKVGITFGWWLSFSSSEASNKRATSGSKKVGLLVVEEAGVGTGAAESIVSLGEDDNCPALFIFTAFGMGGDVVKA